MNKVQYKIIPFALMMAGIFAGLIFSALLAVGAIGSEILEDEPVINIHGVWVEQGVASYMADRFELRSEGVFVDGRQVNTRYEWDGMTLTYRRGEDIYIYTYLSDQFVRQQPAHYISSFSREGTRDALRDATLD
ncbi:MULTISPECIES: DUF2850 domain-containing protein [Photobacterium]|uniref:DUF2850 domain-containing protein n=1 Tax=Photobacterium alginatilyticum TaxID=1775171 RepID=A0ABW9YN30_9GAMM|nr:DUF2850 domain-containing protein [Photobacterium alginatilyticum]NBI55254.1 DUF2850 domain-containing protein [Photobacterium alginatilyticum]